MEKSKVIVGGKEELYLSWKLKGELTEVVSYFNYLGVVSVKCRSSGLRENKSG